MTPDLDKLAALAGAATPIFGGLYAVDVEGRVFSLVSWRGQACRQLVPTVDDGYLRVRLTIDGKRFNAPVHRLVCQAFHGQRPTAFHEARHLDGNPKNNRAENLAWGTAADNAADREAHGRTARGSRSGMHTHPERRSSGDRNGARRHPERLARGERVPNAQLTDDLVRYLRQQVAGGRTATDVAAELGISFSAACRVVRGATWKHVR